MGTKVDLWIDHRKALIVAVTNKGEEIRLITSKVENAVIGSIRDAESILIFGPGEAKGELKKRLERHKLGGRIIGVKTMDKITDNQIAAKVRQYFQEHSSRQQDRDRTT
jgi:hypothetical protein